MNAARIRRLACDYLAAVDKVILALDRAKELRTALRRQLAKQHDKGERQHQGTGRPAPRGEAAHAK